jgi:hypothetical protein
MFLDGIGLGRLDDGLELARFKVLNGVATELGEISVAS